MNLPIYLDHAATTPVAPEVLEAMLPFFTEHYANPASIHSVGMAAREGVEWARESLADTLNCDPDEIVFTSGGTEADNAAIRGALDAGKGRHVLTTAVEHHAVLEPLETREHQGYEVDIVPVDSEGRIDPDEIARRLRPDTTLVSVMHANNEIGTIQPVEAIGALCRDRGVLFHTDAVQTVGRIPVDVRAIRCDFLSLTAHKFYGPKGVGALYVRRGTPLRRFMEGGEQEKGRRAGTLNVPGIVGLGKATELYRERGRSECERLTKLRDWFLTEVEAQIPGARINGSREYRLPNNAHFCFEGVQGEPILLALDAAGICASAGSACSAGSTEPSHVLKAIGVPRDLARSAVRLTMGHVTDREALKYAIDVLVGAVQNLRKLSGIPLAGRR